MPMMQLLRGAARHAGSRPQRNVEQLISAKRGFSSSLQHFSACEGAHSSSRTDTDHPKVLITGRCLSSVFQAVIPSLCPSELPPQCLALSY